MLASSVPKCLCLMPVFACRCALHCSPVPIEALIDYFSELPEEHRTALLTLREEDFAAELDAHMKYQLKICRDCRCNVMRSYRYPLQLFRAFTFFLPGLPSPSSHPLPGVACERLPQSLTCPRRVGSDQGGAELSH